MSLGPHQPSQLSGCLPFCSRAATAYRQVVRWVSPAEMLSQHCPACPTSSPSAERAADANHPGLANAVDRLVESNHAECCELAEAVRPCARSLSQLARRQSEPSGPYAQGWNLRLPAIPNSDLPAPRLPRTNCPSKASRVSAPLAPDKYSTAATTQGQAQTTRT